MTDHNPSVIMMSLLQSADLYVNACREGEAA